MQTVALIFVVEPKRLFLENRTLKAKPLRITQKEREKQIQFEYTYTTSKLASHREH